MKYLVFSSRLGDGDDIEVIKGVTAGDTVLRQSEPMSKFSNEEKFAHPPAPKPRNKPK